MSEIAVGENRKSSIRDTTGASTLIPRAQDLNVNNGSVDMMVHTSVI